jgi:hypothetical protein
MKPSVPVVAVLALLALQGAAHADPVLTDLVVRREHGVYLASCRLDGALTRDTEEEIDAGLEVTIEYRLQVHRRRGGLPDALLVRRRVASAVRLDTLTGQYALTRRVDGEITDTRVTADREEARAFLTRLRDLPLLEESRLQSGGEYYLKARSDLGLVWRFYLIPWSLNTAWKRLDLETPPAKTHATQP